ncbi:MAG: fumarate hydratase [Lachnospiraceae bacterium]|nr:fumarate hydratase [Lachnospiraceae bacterium]
MIRTIHTDIIIKTIKEMCIEANHYLSSDMKEALNHARDTEQSELGKKILNQLEENLQIASSEMITRARPFHFFAASPS